MRRDGALGRLCSTFEHESQRPLTEEDCVEELPAMGRR